MIDLYSSEPHYARHLRPVWHALGPEAGRWHTPDRPTLNAAGPPVLVASGGDARTALDAGREVALMQHGAGQAYNGAGPSNYGWGYVGGPGLDDVGLFLAHTWRDAVEWELANPHATIEVVGSPVPTADVRDALARRAEPVPVVGVTFHWRCVAQIESGTAWPEWRVPVLGLAHDDRVRLLGHEHPRWGGRVLRWWERAGVETTTDADDLLARSSVLVADNTSLMYEAMACGVAVVGLRSHRWRTDVEHGLRFWQYAPPVDLAPGADLQSAVVQAATFGPHPDERAIARGVLGPDDGLAATRAANALDQWARSSNLVRPRGD